MDWDHHHLLHELLKNFLITLLVKPFLQFSSPYCQTLATLNSTLNMPRPMVQGGNVTPLQGNSEFAVILPPTTLS